MLEIFSETCLPESRTSTFSDGWCRGGNSWLAEQGLGVRGSIFGFTMSDSEIKYLLHASRNMTETFESDNMTKKPTQTRGAANRRRIMIKKNRMLPNENCPFYQ